MILKFNGNLRKNFKSPSEIRTHDLQIRSECSIHYASLLGNNFGKENVY